jgi:hypothetical protein
MTRFSTSDANEIATRLRHLLADGDIVATVPARYDQLYQAWTCVRHLQRWQAPGPTAAGDRRGGCKAAFNPQADVLYCGRLRKRRDHLTSQWPERFVVLCPHTATLAYYKHVGDWKAGQPPRGTHPLANAVVVVRTRTHVEYVVGEEPDRQFEVAVQLCSSNGNGGGEGPLMLRGPADKCDTWVAMLRACAAGCRSLSRDGVTCDAQCRSLALRDAMEWTHDDFARRQPWAARHTRRPMLFGRGGGREGTRSAAAAYFGQLCLYALERCADCARRGVALDPALQHLEPFSERLYHCTREMNADPSRGGRCLLDYAGITKAVHGPVWEMANALAMGVERKHEAGRGSIRDDLAFDIGDWIRTTRRLPAERRGSPPRRS